MKNSFRKNLAIIIGYATLLALILVGTFADLQISRSLALINEGEYYTYSFFAAFLEVIGEMPVYILPSIALFIIMQYLLKQKLTAGKRKVIVFVAFLLVFCINLFASYKLLSNTRKYILINWVFSGIFPYVMYTFLAIIFTLLWYISSLAVANKENLKSLAICSLIIILTAILSQAVTQALKPIMLRVRYRYMNTYGNFSAYSPWYKINANNVRGELAKKDWFKSFPSGHASASAIMLTLILFTNCWGEFKRNATRPAIIFIAVLFPVLVSFSRIEAGAHFLTDVCFGLLITLTAMLASVFVTNKWLVKYFK